jgi:DNA-binding NtrC family response regulator
MVTKDRVLLVDDEVEFVNTLAERLRARGLQVEVAASGAEGIEKAKKTVFQAVVLDFAMPGMDGIETLKALRAHVPDIQVMLLTGQATIKAAVEANRLGAVDVLEKPTDIDTLLEKIREARARHLAATERRSEARVEDILHRRGW